RFVRAADARRELEVVRFRVDEVSLDVVEAVLATVAADLDRALVDQLAFRDCFESRHQPAALRASRMAVARSAPVWKRCSKSLASALSTIGTTQSGSVGLSSRIAGCGLLAIANMSCVIDSPSKGRRPESIWKRVTPNEKMSDRPSIFLPA